MTGISAEDLFGGIDLDSVFGDFGLGGGLFERFFSRRTGPPRGADVELEAVVPLERIATGGEETVRFGRVAPCPACSGTGAKGGAPPRTCATCTGTGQKTTSRRDQGVFIRQSTSCPDCAGRGQVIDVPCADCAGSGRVEREESLDVNIPAGAEEGLVLRIPGKGYAAAAPGGHAGDLLLVLRSAPDARFQRDGADLWRLQEIDVADAVLGRELSIPTLDGAVIVKVPPGAQPGAELRLRGKGLPRFGQRGRGDLYVRLAVRVPERLSGEERRLWEKLRALRAAGTVTRS